MQPARRRAESRGPAVFMLTILLVTAAVGAMAVAASRVEPGSNTTQASAAPLGVNSFQTYSELQAFLATNAKSAQNYDSMGGGAFIGGPMMREGVVFNAAGGVAPQAAAVSSQASPSFTTTNIQVQGVDEPDIVKTDGTHLFVATSGTGPVAPAEGGIVVNPFPGQASSRGSVTIMDAYPPDSAAVLSTIMIANATIRGIETSQNRLAVIDQRYTNASHIELLLYDTTDLAAPKLMSNVTVPGSYVAARLADGYLYAIVQQDSFVWSPQGNATGVLPYEILDGARSPVAPTSVYYTSNHAQVGDYTMIVSLSMETGAQKTLAVLTGPSSTVYVSTSNIYVVFTNFRVFESADGIPGDAFSGGVMSPVIQEANSTIFRAAYSNGTVSVSSVGSVPGSVLNQFSMNEYEGYFMAATSRFATIQGSATRSDDVYVLDQGMNQVSSLQNIAPGENLYAVRFVGDMGYVVTFQQVDPLFAISFADVAHPKILSALKVNGYSDYLQQLFPGYLIGVGKDTVPASDGSFAYYLGLKLSLFHVAPDGTSSDVQDYLIGDRGTDSPALTDHLAFTWDPTKNVTVIPVLLYNVSGSQAASQGGVPPYGSPVWQGAYVLRVNASGIYLLGTVSQYPAGQNYGDSPDNGLQIERSVIIGDYLYAVSASEVMVSDMSSFATVATVTLGGS